MTHAPAIGFALPPEQRTLELLGALLRDEPDYFELAPETTWRPAAPGAAADAPFEPNGFHAAFRALGAETGKPFVAHGVGWSPGSVRRDPARDRRWLERIRADQAAFGFLWYTDHLGAARLAGLELALPLPLPMTDEMAGVVRCSLAPLQAIVPDVGLENSVSYYHLGHPLEEPAFLRSALSAPRTHLLLDLHNAYTTALNAGFYPERYLAGLPLERVIEIHVSGGTDSDPAWLLGGRTLRLDGHDAAVPEEVWRLLEDTLPRCPNARGITLERMEGTVGEADVPLLREELRRARRIAVGAGRAARV
jgi:uncharacterized protein (UPF0276 family)